VRRPEGSKQPRWGGGKEESKRQEEEEGGKKGGRKALLSWWGSPRQGQGEEEKNGEIPASGGTNRSLQVKGGMVKSRIELEGRIKTTRQGEKKKKKKKKKKNKPWGP